MVERTQFTFYASIFESARRIRNKAARADFYDAICTYALTGTAPDLDKLSDAAAVGFISAKPNLDASRKKAKSGKAGGSAKQTASKPRANGKQTASKNGNVESEKENEKEVEIESEIENECYISSTATAAEDKAAAEAEASFDLFWEKYPNKVGRVEALAAWRDICVNASVPARVLAGLDRWLSSVEWEKENGRYIPRPANWLSDLRWEEHPRESVPKGASGKLGQAEIDAITRMFAKEDPHE